MIAVIDYGMGNIRSITNAFNAIGAKVSVTNQPDLIADADKLVLPGVGAFGNGIDGLRNLGLIDCLTQAVIENRKPILGICLGMQLFADEGEEFGIHAGLGWIAGRVRKLPTDQKGLKVPHVGWTDITVNCVEPLYQDVNDVSVFYFVHSYYFDAVDKNNVSASFPYGIEIAASIQHENIFGVQFHPEKSQRSGLKILENFSRL